MQKLRYQPPRTHWGKARVYLNRLRVKARSGRWWLRNIVWLGTWLGLGVTAYQRNFGSGLLVTALAIMVAGGRAWGLSGSKTMQQVSREYLERKVSLYKVLRQAPRLRFMTPYEIERYQQDVLLLIVSYVRGYREDVEGTEIFANLMVEEGDDLVVKARSHEHRKPGARYPKAHMVAWEAIQACDVAVLGDISEEEPAASKHAKSYKSVLAIAIVEDDRVLGVVSIDSARAHDFDNESDRLVRYLLPYVCLLGWTLSDNQVGLRDKSKLISPGGA